MAPAASEKKAEKSYIASAYDSINPWAGSRSSTPTPKDPQPSPAHSNPGDHSISSFYGQSVKKYPPDCPPLAVKWFHATDIPKRKPNFLKSKGEDLKKPPAQPKKFVAFSSEDSRSIESVYQARLEELEDDRGSGRRNGTVRAGTKRPRVPSEGERTSPTQDDEQTMSRVPVNEDFLFDVDIEDREMAPVYWLGPVYDVRRGSWFYQEGTTLRPCDENLAAQLEEGYLKVKPWAYPARERSLSGAQKPTPKSSVDNLKESAATQSDGANKSTLSVPQFQPQTYRLFGTYMNSVATYQDASTAYLTSDSMLSWVTSTVYERFAGGGYMSGIKLVRGYAEPSKKKDEKRPVTPTGAKSTSPERGEENIQKQLKRRSAPSEARAEVKQEPGKLEAGRDTLSRQISNLIEGAENPEAEEEAIRKREEKEIEDDYNANVGETQGRDIEHLVLVTHGIGQLLSLRMESINFVHDVNVMRKTMKSVYTESADLRALNSEIGIDGPGNCRVQVLPVMWRHRLDFPKRRRNSTREHDLTETYTEEDEYPALEDITIEGVAFARSLISDLALDVLLYQSAYREQIAEIVLQESNRIYRLFKERNPDFKGKVHIMGHSLGSAIMFDILCRQKERITGYEPPRNPLRFWPSTDRYESRDPKDLAFEFDVNDLYCLGSPVGLFQMLKGRTISARHLPYAMPSNSPLDPDEMQDPFLAAPATGPVDERVSPVTGLPFSVSSPKVQQLFNIFHPSDPIAYRLEPLISSAMASLKPQDLPYTKKGIFGSVAPQGLSGIGAKVGQSVSGLWSSLSAGISNSLINRSLGLTQEDVAKITASNQSRHQQEQYGTSPGAGTNIAAGGVISTEVKLSESQRIEKTAERQRQLAEGADMETSSGNEATLLDDDLETLFSRFQKQRLNNAKEKGAEAPDAERWIEDEQKAAKFKKEENKVRALNKNGRVDYSIQESVLDFNPINTIASHMSYWSDEDVSHFVLSQILANKPRTPRAK